MPELLDRFEKFCLVDLQLSETTVSKRRGHLSQVIRFLKRIGKHPEQVTDDDIRSYLMLYRSKSPYTYANVLKSLKVFCRDFMQMPDVVKSFKFPRRPFKPIQLPTKDEMRQFYDKLPTIAGKVAFLLYASTGLRRKELLSLKMEEIDFNTRMITPGKGFGNQTKHTWVTFFNKEAEQVLTEYLAAEKPSDELFPNKRAVKREFKKVNKRVVKRITPQVLRQWFACELGRLGVPDRYVDAFCGRVPRSVLARHYTDYSSDRLKEIYERARLMVLE
jgi:integrase